MFEITNYYEAYETEALHFRVEASVDDYCTRAPGLSNFSSAESLNPNTTLTETSYVTSTSPGENVSSTTEVRKSGQVAEYAQLFGIDTSLVREARIFNNSEKKQEVIGLCVESNLHQKLRIWIFFEKLGYEFTKYRQGIIDIVIEQSGQNKKAFGLRDILPKLVDQMSISHVGTNLKDNVFGGVVFPTQVTGDVIKLGIRLPPPVGPEDLQFLGAKELRGIHALLAYLWPIIWLHESRHPVQKKYLQALTSQTAIDPETQQKLEKDATGFAFYEIALLESAGINLLDYITAEEMPTVVTLLHFISEVEFTFSNSLRERVLCKVGDVIPAVESFVYRQKVMQLKQQLAEILKDSPKLLSILLDS